MDCDLPVGSSTKQTVSQPGCKRQMNVWSKKTLDPRLKVGFCVQLGKQESVALIHKIKKKGTQILEFSCKIRVPINMWITLAFLRTLEILLGGQFFANVEILSGH